MQTVETETEKAVMNILSEGFMDLIHNLFFRFQTWTVLETNQITGKTIQVLETFPYANKFKCFFHFFNECSKRLSVTKFPLAL